MRSPRLARHTSLVVSLFAALAVFALVACAQGTSGADDDERVDARVTVTDARATDGRPPDASTSIDARQPDAGMIDGGLPGLDGGVGMCTATTQCGVGNCCITQLMVCMPRPDPPFDLVLCLTP